MGEISEEILGKWIKLTRSECSEQYPEELFFQTLNIYFGKTGDEKKFVIWDAGEYYILSDDLIKISTANDKEIIYHFKISDNVLKFRDDEGCEFSYEKLI